MAGYEWKRRSYDSPSQNVIKSRLQLNVVFINAIVKIFCSKNFGNSHQLWRNGNIQEHCNEYEYEIILMSMILLKTGIYNTTCWNRNRFSNTRDHTLADFANGYREKLGIIR